ncbi:hypothetical protein CC80DRAFT_590193 [Byssothecium circinans]|uniref:GED domain-containing protein n=1 Tax=Byssothecium circinans TaxID=147558 RepID=A0A6A5U870_9PLEO|nr:hypothetical protein CC80DRAFT_590193 [Byssothecium circinans]
MFCPKSVLAMSPDLIKRIASELEDKTIQRKEINDKLVALEAGNDLCKQYALHVTSDLPVRKKVRYSRSLSTTSTHVSVGLAEETPKSEGSESDVESS